jgi:hypothetical protein
MIPLTVNEEVATVLGGYVDAVEVRDEQGRVLGHFVPYVTPQARDVYEHPEKYFNLEETQRRAAAEHGQGRPLAEILHDLKASERPG